MSPTLSARGKRPTLHTRTFSNSSATSIASNRSEGSIESPTNAVTASPAQSLSINMENRELQIREEVLAAVVATTASPLMQTTSIGATISQHILPVAIEIPAVRQLSRRSACTPPEPLSARGDVRGGYFPFHEDPDHRVHHPHPFHSDSQKARQQSVSRAAEGDEMTFGDSEILANSKLGGSPSSGHNALIPPVSDGSSQSIAPVISYIPIGSHDSPLPIGKYYPSNYVNKDPLCSLSPLARPVDDDRREPLPNPIAKASPRIVRPRTDSDVKAKLQQYQRDMVAQATLAARQALGSAVLRHGPSSLNASMVTEASSSIASRKEFKFSTAIMLRPISPRLLPMGSPGPVTPMELESKADYLTVPLDEMRHNSAPAEADALN